MRKLISILVAALFAAVTFSAYAADPAPAGDPSTATKPPRRKRSIRPSQPRSTSGTVQQGTPQTSGRGDPSGAASGGTVKQGQPQSEWSCRSVRRALPGSSDNRTVNRSRAAATTSNSSILRIGKAGLRPCLFSFYSTTSQSKSRQLLFRVQSIFRGQLLLRSRDSARSANTFPPV
jgi:hypothetical protein